MTQAFISNLAREGEKRPFKAHGHAVVGSAGAATFMKGTFEPGWRWSRDVRPIAGTDSCQHRHLGYIIAGTLHVETDDGTVEELTAGDAYEIPPGHDAWVVGDEAWDAIEFTSGRTFAMTRDDLAERILATVLFTDIVDSTAQLSRLGDSAWRRILLEHNDRLRGELDRFRGREIETTGDGFLARF